MKRLLYILLCLPFWLACTDEHIPVSNYEVEEGKEVQLRMSVALEEMNVASSRSFGDEISDYPTLWVVAFNKDGYLVEYAKATDLKRVENGTLHETEFSVILHATSDARTLHFIAFGRNNDTEDDYELNLEYGHESNVIGSLVVDNNRDVYWHRKVFSEGINKQPDYISANFRRIPLLRNFAKITVGVDTKVDNFKLTGFYVLNVPQSGTVAPYSNGAFVDYMAKDENGAQTEEAKTYEKLNEEGYIGTMPNDVEYDQDGSSISWENGSFYMYENTYRKVEDETTSILIKGKFNGSSDETYYRADLILPDVATGLSTYYHILRNFHYHLNITSVAAAGKGTPDEAISAGANNNLSGSVQVQNLSNISDGTAKLEVSYTDMVLVTTDKVTLKYRFLTSVGDTTSHTNDRIKIYLPEGDVIDNYTVATSNETYKDKNGVTQTSSWRVITITPVGTLPEATQVQTLTLYDEATKLRREVQYTLRSKLDMVVKCVPKKVESTAGTDVEVDICIPNNLNENLFPLDFAIEAQTSAASTTLKQYISPAKTEVMSVTTGGSIVDGHLGEKSYQYIKELTYEVYKELELVDGCRVFPVDFVTNIAASASMVYVDNKYFNKGSDFFVNTLPALMDTEYYGVGKDVFYVLEASTAGDYTIEATNATPETQTVRLAANDVYETILKTTTWSDRTSVTVGSTTKEGTTTRNKLAMKAASTSGTDLTASTELYVYTSDNDARALAENSLGMVTNGTLTSSFNGVITANGLLETTPIYFAYETAEYYYVASATAKALAEGTAELVFGQIEKPLKWSAELTGEQYYGIGKTVILTLTTNKPGTYNVSFAETGTNGGTAATITVSNGSTEGTATYTTQSWSGAISATVTPDTPLTGNSLSVSGDTRNVLKIIANIDNNNTNAENYITNNSNGNTEIRIRSRNGDNNGTTYGTITAASWLAGTAEITYSGLQSSTELYFRFDYTSGRWEYTASANVSAENATKSSTSITFN